MMMVPMTMIPQGQMNVRSDGSNEQMSTSGNPMIGMNRPPIHQNQRRSHLPRPQDQDQDQRIFSQYQVTTCQEEAPFQNQQQHPTSHDNAMNLSNSLSGIMPSSSSQQSNSMPPLNTHHNGQHLGSDMIDPMVNHTITSNQEQSRQQQHQHLVQHWSQQEHLPEHHQQSQMNQFRVTASNEPISFNPNDNNQNWTDRQRQLQQHTNNGEQINHSSGEHDEGGDCSPGGNLAHCA